MASPSTCRSGRPGVIWAFVYIFGGALSRPSPFGSGVRYHRFAHTSLHSNLIDVAESLSPGEFLSQIRRIFLQAVSQFLVFLLTAVGATLIPSHEVGRQGGAANAPVGRRPEGTAGVTNGRWRGGAATLRGIQHDWPLVLIDAGVIAASWTAALLLRFDAEVPMRFWDGLWAVLPVALGTGLLANASAGLYSEVWQHASVFEARRILGAQGASLLVLVVVVLMTARPVPLSVPLIAATLTAGAMGAVRFQSRLFAIRRRQERDVERVVVLGAGSAGASLAHDVSRRGEPVRLVAFLDDDPSLLGRKVQGVTVRGTLAELERVATDVHASSAVLAIPSASQERIRAIAAVAERAGISLRVVPPPSELVNGEVHLNDVRDIEIADLLGRRQIQESLDDVRSLIQGKRVLITGAGGSIGSEIARQVVELDAARVALLDHDETHLFDIGCELPSTVQRLADIRDRDAVEKVLREERPDIVFHAAAHKHVPLLEDHAVEAVQTNVFGTATVVAAARAAGVSRFVFISTDKAVDPSSVMGASKCLAEHVVLDQNRGLTTCAVRFGNVLGSRGSVVPTFVRQIRAGGPVTITDARMTRYFMSIPEAVRLVLHAAALSSGGEIYMLDMGRPVRIIDLAHRMIRLSGHRPGLDVEIRVTGIRPGEKLAEALRTQQERSRPTAHPAIAELTPTVIGPDVMDLGLEELTAAVRDRDDAAARDLLFGLARSSRARPHVPLQRTHHEAQPGGRKLTWT